MYLQFTYNWIKKIKCSFLSLRVLKELIIQYYYDIKTNTSVESKIVYKINNLNQSIYFENEFSVCKIFSGWDFSIIFAINKNV